MTKDEESGYHSLKLSPSLHAAHSHTCTYGGEAALDSGLEKTVCSCQLTDEGHSGIRPLEGEWPIVLSDPVTILCQGLLWTGRK